MTLAFAEERASAIPLCVVHQDDFSNWHASQPDAVQTWVDANGFVGALGDALMIPNDTGTPGLAVVGYGTAAKRARVRFPLAAGALKLPAGTYKIVEGLPEAVAATETLGWLLTGYAFDRYKAAAGHAARLVAPEGVDAALVERLAAAERLTRDLINTPAADMGPDALEAAARDLATAQGAQISVISGADLLAQNFPMIHAVGRAAAQAPRLIELRKGDTGPKLTLVGKGVCFDTGGLNLKPGGSMGLMKKDMGGAANVLGLAQLILASNLPVQLRVLIPAVENAVAGNAFRPGDVLTARNGQTVEINNTDAEGRLVLADALALGQEEEPDLMISMATLTGAARVAVGPDLAPFYTDHAQDAAALAEAAQHHADPVWQMPFHTPYEAMIEPQIADLDNAPSGGFAGSITAALFLRRFAGNARYMHFDIYGWCPSAKPGLAKGGVTQGVRALFASLPGMLSL
ncbi:leucyl aminopeptidase family protein [Epibacterium sp. SM1979]|uniref:Leucyl aminopeptidase family protein n=1 Tax=Tritonibacter litoralis TaxID=2662264 RepID=A0A843YC67_9RHOB|nr:leucyl aminopeptidase family protein [Tritonibacter litoralis]MQQ08596.1 leucyl aminopeptidase family protein [Tritonibacter litoralis]